MTVEDQIVPPALAPAEWAGRRTPSGAMTVVAVTRSGGVRTGPLTLTLRRRVDPAYDGYAILDVEEDVAEPGTDDPAAFHALAALGNAALPDGDARKLTGSDVWLVGFALRTLRDHAATLDAGVQAEYAEGLAGLAQTVAKLAALLPPDELTVAT